MKQDNKTDWKMVEILYCQGLRPMIIEQRTGVNRKLISQKAIRKGWKNSVMAAQTVMKNEPNLADIVAESSLKARNKLSKHLAACVDRIEDPSDMTEALEQQAKLVPLISNAEKLFQWSQSSTTQLINITSLSSDPVQDEAMPTIELDKPS